MPGFDSIRNAFDTFEPASIIDILSIAVLIYLALLLLKGTTAMSLLRGIVIVVVGGMGSLAGAFVASLLIGCMQTFAVSLDWSLGGITIAQAAPVLPYLLMVLMLILRPRGLMGTRDG